MPGARPNALQASYFGLPPSETLILCIDGIDGIPIPLNGSLPLISILLKSSEKAEEREYASPTEETRAPVVIMFAPRDQTMAAF